MTDEQQESQQEKPKSGGPPRRGNDSPTETPDAPTGTVPTPSGPQPVSTVASSKEEAEEILEEQRRAEEAEAAEKESPSPLAKAQILDMARADVRSMLQARHGIDPNETAHTAAGVLRRQLIELEGVEEDE